MEQKMIDDFAEYLNVSAPTLEDENEVPVIKHNGSEFTGMVSIMLKMSEEEIERMDNEEKYIIYQWLEYRINTDTQDGITILQNLNNYLENCSYLSGYEMSPADFAVYYALYNIMDLLGPNEKQAYTHICRWIDHMQSFKEVRQNNEPLNFFSNHY